MKTMMINTATICSCTLILLNLVQCICGLQSISRMETSNEVEDTKVNTRTFTIDYKNNTFLKDGEAFQYVSGSMHYMRIPHYYWADRLRKMHAAGLDAAQTYVAWNIHEPQPGVYDFNGQNDLGAFLKTAQDEDMLIILRAGPYICGEWEYGGLPGWLLSDNVTMLVRSMDAKYIKAVDRWLSVLLPYIKPYLYINGGPVIMVQVENEYGSYYMVDCGHDYMAYLRDTFRKYLGDDVVLFTTDGNAVFLLKCGNVEGVYGTVDFGPDQTAQTAFAPMRQWNPTGPLVNSEMYTGWLDYWYGGHAHGDTATIIRSLKEIHAMGASVSMYMFEGGTSFGYMNGADPTYNVCPTSYDYDAPLTEAGDITDKYLAIRNFTSTYKTLPPVPPNIVKFAYGTVSMSLVAPVLDLLQVVAQGQSLKSHYPLNMEQSMQYYGFVLYRHTIDKNYRSGVLAVPGVRDRGYVLLDGEPKGMVDRNQATSFMMYATVGQVLDIIVENQGRINYGPPINDNKKGILSNVTLNGDILTGWEMIPVNFTKTFDIVKDKRLRFRPSNDEGQQPLQPAVYTGQFTLPNEQGHPHDTYLQPCGWFKGQAFLNGFNLGRYWPVVGPQVTLYVPAGVLVPAPQPNILLFVELEGAPSTAVHGALDTVKFVDTPIINSRCFEDGVLEELAPREVNDGRQAKHWNRG